jgi:hypothetical protein
MGPDPNQAPALRARPSKVEREHLINGFGIADIAA